jgi:eukaryotic-like serine/threonine-protein kinase
LATECRYPAARCAALAGCGLGDDGARLNEAERMRWRRQAREWLRADLEVWAKILDSGSPAARVFIRKILIQWQADPDLARLRESNAMANLPTDERTECLALWQAVGNLLRRAREAR